ncbi:MAG TPA: tetratricopeptide repeat protein [Gemmatimonadaceae bacterium]
MRFLAPVALAIASTACFATRNDVRILQGDIFALKTQQAQADSARARQLADIAAAVNTLNSTLGVVRDSVQDQGARLTTFQGATRQELYSLGQQLLQLGELMGQSQAAMARFRADIEDQNRQVMEQAIRAAAPPAAAGDTTQAVVVPPAPGEGPNVLYEIGRNMLMQSSYSAARDAFGQIIERFPDSDRAPDAQLGIAEAFQAEKRVVEEDSTYRLVIEKYPRSDAAPASMYKLGLSLDRQGKRAEARATMQRVVREYPGSDSYTLATDWLNKNP